MITTRYLKEDYYMEGEEIFKKDTNEVVMNIPERCYSAEDEIYIYVKPAFTMIDNMGIAFEFKNGISVLLKTDVELIQCIIDYKEEIEGKERIIIELEDKVAELEQHIEELS